VLTIHALSSGTLATLAEIDDGLLWGLNSVDRDLVEGVLDCCDCHVGCSLWYEYSIGQSGAESGAEWSV